MKKRIILIATMVTSLGVFCLGMNLELKNEAQVKKTNHQSVIYVNDPSGW